MANQPLFDFKVQDFLKLASQFQLGDLPTEKCHPRTMNLSVLAKEDISQAISLLKSVELEALTALDHREQQLDELAVSMEATLKSGGRIFFAGCGATGRLSLSLETLWREEVKRLGRHDLSEKVLSFIAGGDYALVRSVESFEDHPDYGARQLHDLGFGANDLLVGCTEGGETPFVIGAVEEATKISKRNPYFMYCNPTAILRAHVDRSRNVIDNAQVHAVEFETGPMALAGSTRLQASTTLMLAAGSALFSFLREQNPIAFVKGFKSALAAAKFETLAPLIRREAEIYNSGRRCVHRTQNYGITVLTDTTERTPTFSLMPFESCHEKQSPLSWTYLNVPAVQNADEAWQAILHRQPRAIEWENFSQKIGQRAVMGFDFSDRSLERRSAAAVIEIFDIDRNGEEITLRLSGLTARLNRPSHLLLEHLLLKCAMNICSTLVMGRLNRYSGNMMLYVRASNFKLVDRSIRYVRTLLKQEGIEGYSYEEICEAIFETQARLAIDEPVVLRTFETLRDRARLPRVAGG